MAAKKPTPPAKWVATMGLTIDKLDVKLKVGDEYPGNPPKWLKDQGKVVKADG